MQRAPLPQPFTPAGGAAYNDPALAQTLEDAVRRLAYDLGGSDLGADEHSDAASDSAAPGLHRNSDYSDAGSALEREPASDDAASTFSRSAPEHQPPMSDGRLADDDAASIPPSTAGPRTDGLAQTHSAAAADKKRSARSAPFFHIFKKGDRQRSTESFASSSVPARDQEQPADDPGASGPARSVHGIAREQSAWISHHPFQRPKTRGHLKNDCTFSRLALVQELVCPGRDESSGQSANSFASQGSGSAPPTTQTGLPSSYGKSDRASDAASISARLRRAHNSKVFDKDSAGAPVWALSFSPDGQYLAAGSQDGVLAIWVVAAPRHDDSPDDSARRFGSDPAIQCLAETEPNLRNIRTRTLSQSSDSFTIAGAPQSTPSSASIRQQGFPSSVSRLLINDRSYRSDLMTSRLAASPSRETFASSNSSSASQAQAIPQAAQLPPLQTQSEILRSQPLRVFKAHTHAITSIAWSKGGFLVSASMDCTVHLWHVSCMDFLCVFHHNDCVTSVCFHPKDERLFLSGSLDGQLHLWSIQDKRVRSRNEIHRSAVTAVTFSRDGNTVVAGTMQGDCVFYETQGLKYNTQIQVVTPSTLKSSKDVKITSIVPLPPSPGDAHQDEKFLVASTDSRVRIINSRDKSLLRKFRGAELRSAYLAASASDDGDYIICPSEDRQVLIWDAEPGEQSSSFANMLGGMKWQVDASKNWGVERFTASDVFVTAATAVDGMIIVVADALGRIRIFQNGTSGAGTGGSPSASGASNASSIRKEPSRLGKFRAPIRIRPSGSIKPGASADADHTESSSQ
nr:WD repeat-containing protein 44 [Polyrhizophydium stewartii]